MDRRHNVSSRNINLNSKIALLHVPQKKKKMKDSFISYHEARESKQLETWTCIIWLRGIAAFEGKIAMKALAPSAREFLIGRQMMKVASPLFQWISHKCSAYPWRY